MTTSRATKRRAWWGERWRTSTGDDGQTTILAIGFCVLALLLVTAVVSATGVHLDRKRLLATADAAAITASDEVSAARYYAGDQAGSPGGHVPITDAGVRRAVQEFLADHPELVDGLDDVQVLEASSPDGRTAVVRLGAFARPALISWITAPWSEGIALEAASSARAW
ncbi:pilus assembly protein TadG-related protein [Cellulomonas chengniuliangii]|uniref:Pilus assembly protein TadG-related protein n=1 Tax=Cellulomonas chengniuliangii TaxID=2968084 RepID=A0ABY5KV74_9CELL|nr:pilus assembly protein TadG-related protein [Cellulomonas chengniuliangii]MCC2308823.1 pilus assembly protein TadG-related protein [Cellulomonas chengniuliangii]UUI74431.1 pilus assembly protein TadG-related protein [Cellulomonas chengniuliangii]